MKRNISFHLGPEAPQLDEDETEEDQRVAHMASHRSWSQPAQEEHYESYGFIQTGEDQVGYQLRRSKSTSSIDREESLFQVNRNLEKQLRALQTDVGRLKRKIAVFEQSNDRWGVRYSKRVAMFTNLIMGVWIFWYRLLLYFQRRKRIILSQVVAVQVSKSLDTNSVTDLLRQGIASGFKSSAFFLLASLFLSRRNGWTRTLGSCVGCGWSLWIALVTDFYPWANYFNTLACLLYLTAAFAPAPPAIPAGAPTLKEYNRGDGAQDDLL
jgi:hypothetical protein